MVNNKTQSLLTILSTEIVDRIICTIFYNKNRNFCLNLMHENNNYNYKKGIRIKKSFKVFSKWFRSLQIYWIMQRAFIYWES